MQSNIDIKDIYLGQALDRGTATGLRLREANQIAELLSCCPDNLKPKGRLCRSE